MRVRLYILAIMLTAGMLAVALLVADPHFSVRDLVLMIGFGSLIALASRVPLHFDFKNNIVLDTGLIYTAALLLSPGQAMLAAGSGALIGHLSRGAEREEVAFNASQVMLQAGAAGLALWAFGWNPAIARFDQPGDMLGPLVAAGLIYLVNTVLVALVIALQTGLSPFIVWIESLTRNDGLEQASQFVLGLIAAVLTATHVWLIPLLVVPLCMVYVAIQRQARLRFETIDAVEMLADLVDRRDPYTANHSRSVAGYAREIATRMGLGSDEIDLIERAGRVHDLGKIVIDRSLLAKPGKLTAEEWAIFQEHPVVGAEILVTFEEFRTGVAFVRSHHERIDGNGYPDGLAGNQIPLGARILAVADGFDAMASARPYRDGLPREVVLEELARGRGSQWDASAVDALLALIDEGRIRFSDQFDHPEIVDGFGSSIPAPTRISRAA